MSCQDRVEVALCAILALRWAVSTRLAGSITTQEVGVMPI